MIDLNKNNVFNVYEKFKTNINDIKNYKVNYLNKKEVNTLSLLEH